MKKQKLLVAAILSWSMALFGQYSINAGGGSTTGSGGSASFSIGQVFYQSFDSPNGFVEHGVQHAYEVGSLSAKEDLLSEISVYPNPTTDDLFIRSEGKPLNFQLFDGQGKMISQGSLKSETDPVSLKAYPIGMYILKIATKDNRRNKTFKIIKK